MVISKDMDKYYETLSDKMEGYSGSDIVSVCKEAVMIPLRCVINNIQNDVKREDEADKIIERKLVTRDDVLQAISKIKPSCDKSRLSRYISWTDEFSSV